MKIIYKAMYLLTGILLLPDTSALHAQLLKSVKNEIHNRAARQAVNTAGEATDASINQAKKEAVNAVKGTQTEDKDSPVEKDESISSAPGGSSAQNTTTGYKNYDFVAGDQIIFQPDLSGEADAELPERFRLYKGNAEIQTYQGEKILHLDEGGYATVSPLMNSEAYLPDQFTLEFDLMYENKDTYFRYANDFFVEFRKAADQNYDSYPLYKFKIEGNNKGIWGDNSAGRQSFPEALAKTMSTGNTWHHIAIYIRKNIGKVYIDQYRVAASNTMPVAAEKVNLRTDGRYGFKIKNFRIAAGGSDKYQEIVSSGKFITHGILFDVNQSVIRAESMGALNEIARLMQAHAGLRFEIDGHTDSDGAETDNMNLSRKRAEAVRAKLISMGISAERLTAKGFGESRPIDKNETAEGKANNRRVEFIKI